MLSFHGPTRAALAVAVGLTVMCPILAAGADAASAAGAPDGAAAAAAADDASASSSDLQSVVITARRLNEARATIETQTGASTYTIDSAAIQAMPGGDNALLNQVILQAPEVAQDSFGQLHIRGEHNGLQYRLNGIILPEGISVFSQTLDPRLVSSMQLIMGALPAEYGLRTAGIIDLTTKSGVLEPNGAVSFYGGSHQEIEPSLYDGGSLGPFTYFVTGDYLRNDLGIESPDGSSNPIHDHTTQYHGFGYFEYILDSNDRLSAILGTSRGQYQIPNNPGLTPSLGLDVQGVTYYPSADFNENQTEITQYGIASYQHSEAAFDVQTSFSYRYTSLNFTPDPLGDLLYNGVAQNAYKRDEAYGWQTDAAIHVSANHTVRLGFYLQHDLATSNTSSQVLLSDPTNPTGFQTVPTTIIDNSMQVQNIESAYLQDEWQIVPRLTANYGVRFDHLDAYTSGQQVSPRLNLVWKPADGTTVHGGYSRYFSPPPFELIGLESINKFVNTSNAPLVDQADPPLPESANYYDLGVQQQLAAGLTVGLDNYYKQSKNLIDEGQFGAPIILTPFNYRYGQQYGTELTLNYVAQTLSLYANFAEQRALGKDIESAEFNFDPDALAYITNHFINLDHEQRYTGSAGASYLWAGTRFSADMIFGSGLRADLVLPDGTHIPNGEHLPYYTQVNLGVSHTFAYWGSGSSKLGPTLRFDVINATDAVYQIRNGTGVGVGAPQYGPRRGFFGGISVPF